MSGIEAVGIVLGSIPLLISALEHYEQGHKAFRDWWNFRTNHRQDVRRYKDCLVDFRNNLRELLHPLVYAGTLEQTDVETLLASPSAAGWKERQIEEALSKRFNSAETHERYVHILEDMIEALAYLSSGCHVEDRRFQEMLRVEEGKSDTSSSAQARAKLKLRANIALEGKRITYTFAGEKRAYQLADVEKCNDMLQKVLASNDRLSRLAENHPPVLRRGSKPKGLDFWKHAKAIFELLDRSWQCNCRVNMSTINLWLQQHLFSNDSVAMSMQFGFCHGTQAVNVRLSEEPRTIQLIMPIRGTSPAALSNVTIPGSASLWPSSSVTPTARSDIIDNGLCHACSVNPQCALVGGLSSTEDTYTVHSVKQGSFGTRVMTLADLLRCPQNMSREDRYGLAFTIASSHLQLSSTPWLSGAWSPDHILFHVDCDGSILFRSPYICKSVDRTTRTIQQSGDLGFSILGIILLELCFGRRFEDYGMWQEPSYAPLINHKAIRHAVACEWCKAVQSEAGGRYAEAVSWTLRPAVNTDSNWRSDFAKGVVQPLQQTYEFMTTRQKSQAVDA